MNQAHRRSYLRVLAVCAALCALCPFAHAQFSTNVALNKDTYLTYEAVEATVTVTNRSGSDIVMGGPNGQSWLVFEVMDPSGNRVTPMRMRSDETLVFKAGSTISRTVKVSDYFPFSDYGSYSVTGAVYHPPTQQYFTSNRTRAMFTEAKAFWDQSYGVPLGLQGAGQVRRYTLSLLRDSEHTFLYVRVLDDKTSTKLSTLSLGMCIMVADPQVSLDSGNKLHVLYMARPQIYAHSIVDTQGHLVKTTAYEMVQNSRPQLVVQADQTIGVQGGTVYDPAAAAARAAPPKGRSIGDKPPGL